MYNVSLKDVLTFKNGKKRPKGSGNIPVYGGNGILGYTDKSNYENCIVVGRVGAYCGSVYYEPNQCWVSDNAICGTPHKNVDIYYTMYLLKSLHLNQRHIGTSQPLLTQEILNSIECKVPSFNIQKKISEILLSIDNKIENNNAINRNLSEQAQAIYESWFVSFEKFGGMVPLDWGEGVLGDIAEIKTTTFKPDKEPDVIVEHHSIPALDEKHFPVFELAEGIKSNKYLLNKNCVMISKLNPDTKRIWRPLCLSDKPVCSTEFIVFEAKNKKNKDFIFSILDSDKFSNHLCSHVTGSTGSRQRAVPKATLDFKVLIPPSEVIEQFCSMVTPIYDLIGVNEIENQRLSELRDSLLPKLMSGELNVSSLNI